MPVYSEIILMISDNSKFYISVHIMYRGEIMDIYNYLVTAMMPLCKTMYIYGGGWDYEDRGAGRDAMTYGISQSWVAFANNATGDYDFRKYNCRENKEYSHLGLDCSGYIGWVIYNTIGKEKINNSIADKIIINSINKEKAQNVSCGGSDNKSVKKGNCINEEMSFDTAAVHKKGYVFKSDTVIYRLRALGFGEIIPSQEEIGVGDICSSVCGCCHHVYISMGACSDGSRLVLHSSPPGVQLSPTVDREGRENSLSKELAAYYMKKYYPVWYSRYGVEVKPISYLTHYRGLRLNSEDKTGIRKKSADDILALIFSDKATIVD